MSIFHSKTQFKKTAIAGALSMVAILSGCDSDDPDAGSSVDRQALSGIVVDGYIAGARVYLDTNENGRMNGGEPNAITDKDGYFSVSKDGNTDYCADDATELESRHCLSAVETGNEVILRIHGGFDVTTGEPFKGSMSARVSASDFDSKGVLEDQLISPITSLLVDLPSDDVSNVEGVYGLLFDNIGDFLSTDSFDANATNAAIAFHKVVTIFADVLDDHYEEIGSTNFQFPQSSSVLIYENIAELVGNDGGTKLTSVNVGSIFSSTEDDIEDLYNDLEEDFEGSVDSSDKAAAILNAGKILDLIDGALATSGVDVIDIDDVQARLIGVEMVVQKVLDGDADETEIDAAIAVAEVQGNTLQTTVQAALDNDNNIVDFSALVDVTFTGGTPVLTDVTIVNPESFSGISGKQLMMTYDVNEDLDDDKSGNALFEFSGSGDAGTLTACLSYKDPDEDDSEESDGTHFDGEWFLIDDYHLVMTLAGAYDLILTSKGERDVDSVTKKRFGFTFGGDTVSWLSDDGLVEDGDSMPTTDNACESLFES